MCVRSPRSLLKPQKKSGEMFLLSLLGFPTERAARTPIPKEGGRGKNDPNSRNKCVAGNNYTRGRSGEGKEADRPSGANARYKVPKNNSYKGKARSVRPYALTYLVCHWEAKGVVSRMCKHGEKRKEEEKARRKRVQTRQREERTTMMRSLIPCCHRSSLLFPPLCILPAHVRAGFHISLP